MNEQELKDAISDMQECRELIGKANMKLNNILTQRKADMQKKLDDAYKLGLNDAWGAARQIACSEDLTAETMDHIFGWVNAGSVFRTYSASEAITKLKAYEIEKNDIRFGDEVVVHGRDKGLIISSENGDRDEIWVLIAKYSAPQRVSKRSVAKTGRQFGIESILKEMM